MRQEWQPERDESLYGLGQHQQGLLDIRVTDLDLRQYNTEITFRSSSRAAATASSGTTPPLRDSATSARRAAPRTSPGSMRPGRRSPGDVAWRKGRHASTGAARSRRRRPATTRSAPIPPGGIKLRGRTTRRSSITGGRDGCPTKTSPACTSPRASPCPCTSAMDAGHRREHRAPALEDAGREPDHLAVVGGGGRRRLLLRVRSGRSTTSSPATAASPGVRRCCRAGPSVSGSRASATSHAQEILDVLAGYRARSVPVDNIVQDWQYWPEDKWGSHAVRSHALSRSSGLDRTRSTTRITRT